MCGVFGYQFSKNKTLPIAERGVLCTLLAEEIQSRGRDASGYAVYDERSKKILFRKTNGPFLQSGLLAEMIRARCAFGHTRYATVGAKTEVNAHPWHIGNLVGAHNGGIFNHRELQKKYPDRDDYEVDSMHLIRHIADGLDTKELEGYGTVQWMDTHDMGAVYLCAMNRGDLEIEVFPDGGVVWASTTEALRVALQAIKMYATTKKMIPVSGAVYRVFEGKIEKTDRTIELKSSTWSRTPKGGYNSTIDNASPVSVVRSSSVVTTTVRNPIWVQEPGGKWVRDTEKEAAYLLEHAAASTTLDVAISAMTRRSRKKFGTLLEETEFHTDLCRCGSCSTLLSIATDAIVAHATEHTTH